MSVRDRDELLAMPSEQETRQVPAERGRKRRRRLLGIKGTWKSRDKKRTACDPWAHVPIRREYIDCTE